MPHLSQKELDLKTKKQIEDTFELVLGKLNKDEVNDFLFSILSSTEKLMLSKRLSTAMLLKERVDQSSIKEALCVTPETINRINLAYLLRPKGFEIAFKKINEDKVMQGIKKALVNLASYSIKAAGGRVKL